VEFHAGVVGSGKGAVEEEERTPMSWLLSTMEVGMRVDAHLPCTRRLMSYCHRSGMDGPKLTTNFKLKMCFPSKPLSMFSNSFDKLFFRPPLDWRKNIGFS
jgi:hypothetical protein